MNGLQVVNGGPGEASEKRRSEVSEVTWVFDIMSMWHFSESKHLQRNGGFVRLYSVSVDLTISYNKQVRLQTRSVCWFHFTKQTHHVG